MSAAEFRAWMAYYEIEPFGEERADLRAGILAATLVNINRRKGRKAVTAHELMPYLTKAAEPKEPAGRMAALMRAIMTRQRKG